MNEPEAEGEGHQDPGGDRGDAPPRQLEERGDLARAVAPHGLQAEDPCDHRPAEDEERTRDVQEQRRGPRARPPRPPGEPAAPPPRASGRSAAPPLGRPRRMASRLKPPATPAPPRMRNAPVTCRNSAHSYFDTARTLRPGTDVPT